MLILLLFSIKLIIFLREKKKDEKDKNISKLIIKVN